MVDVEEDNDMQLVERCRAGDEQAFERLYNRYRLPLFSYLHKLLVGRPHLVDDIFQQVWIKVPQNLDKYSDQQRFLAWLCRIAHNLVMDLYRRNHNMVMTELTEDIAASEAPEVGEARDREAFEHDLELAIEGLSKEQREVVQLRRAGVSFKDIADRQKTNLNTVLGRMHYAVRNLQDKLREYIE